MPSTYVIDIDERQFTRPLLDEKYWIAQEYFFFYFTAYYLWEEIIVTDKE